MTQLAGRAHHPQRRWGASLGFRSSSVNSDLCQKWTTGSSSSTPKGPHKSGYHVGFTVCQLQLNCSNPQTPAHNRHLTCETEPGGGWCKRTTACNTQRIFLLSVKVTSTRWVQYSTSPCGRTRLSLQKTPPPFLTLNDTLYGWRRSVTRQPVAYYYFLGRCGELKLSIPCSTSSSSQVYRGDNWIGLYLCVYCS